MTKEQFLEKYELNELDWRNLIRYEEARKGSKMNMFEYLNFMREFNINGGKKLATWILDNDNYSNFLETLKNEKEVRTMKLHTLKILPQYYVAIENGEKTFELRKNDRDYKVGDLITFTNTVGIPYITLHKERIVFRITYILENVVEYGLKDGYCILALKRL